MQSSFALLFILGSSPEILGGRLEQVLRYSSGTCTTTEVKLRSDSDIVETDETSLFPCGRFQELALNEPTASRDRNVKVTAILRGDYKSVVQPSAQLFLAAMKPKLVKLFKLESEKDIQEITTRRGSIVVTFIIRKNPVQSAYISRKRRDAEITTPDAGSLSTTELAVTAGSTAETVATRDGDSITATAGTSTLQPSVTEGSPPVTAITTGGYSVTMTLITTSLAESTTQLASTVSEESSPTAGATVGGSEPPISSATTDASVTTTSSVPITVASTEPVPASASDSTTVSTPATSAESVTPETASQSSQLPVSDAGSTPEAGSVTATSADSVTPTATSESSQSQVSDAGSTPEPISITATSTTSVTPTAISESSQSQVSDAGSTPEPISITATSTTSVTPTATSESSQSPVADGGSTPEPVSITATAESPILDTASTPSTGSVTVTTTLSTTATEAAITTSSGPTEVVVTQPSVIDVTGSSTSESSPSPTSDSSAESSSHSAATSASAEATSDYISSREDGASPSSADSSEGSSESGMSSPGATGAVSMTIIASSETPTNSPRNDDHLTPIDVLLHFDANYTAKVSGQELRFKEHLVAQLARRVRIPKECFQGVSVQEGSIRLGFNLVPVATDESDFDRTILLSAKGELINAAREDRLNVTDLGGVRLVVIPPPNETQHQLKYYARNLLAVVIALTISCVSIFILIVIIGVLVMKLNAATKHASSVENGLGGDMPAKYPKLPPIPRQRFASPSPTEKPLPRGQVSEVHARIDNVWAWFHDAHSQRSESTQAVRASSDDPETRTPESGRFSDHSGAISVTDLEADQMALMPTISDQENKTLMDRWSSMKRAVSITSVKDLNNLIMGNMPKRNKTRDSSVFKKRSSNEHGQVPKQTRLPMSKSPIGGTERRPISALRVVNEEDEAGGGSRTYIMEQDDLERDISSAVPDVVADAKRPTTSLSRRPTSSMIVQSRIRNSAQSRR